MHFINHQQKLKSLCKLIESEFTGKPEQLAILLGVPESILRRYIDHLKNHGANIRYSRSLQSYYFASPFRLRTNVRTLQLEKAQAG